MATRWPCPPESSRGQRSAWSARPTRSSASRDAACALRRRQFGKPEADIAGDRQPGQEARLLENDTDAWMRRGDDRAVDAHCAARRVVQPGQQTQQRALAAAGAADHGKDFTRLDGEREPAKRNRAVGIGFCKAFDRQHVGASHRPPE